MIWDFRVVRRKIHGRDIYQVHRVFYNDDLKTQPNLIEEIPATIVGIGALPMLQDVELLTNAFDQPTLYIPEWNVGQS